MNSFELFIGPGFLQVRRPPEMIDEGSGGGDEEFLEKALLIIPDPVVEFPFFFGPDLLLHDFQDPLAPEAKVLVVHLEIEVHQALADRLVDKFQDFRLHDLWNFRLERSSGTSSPKAEA